MKRSPALAFGVLVVLAALLMGPSAVAAADADLRIGTWKLNVAKSKFDPGPAPKSQTRTYEVFEGDGVKYTQDSVNADGSQLHTTFSGHYDGKDNKWTGNPNNDTVAIKRVDPYTTENTQKKAGKVTQLGRITVSKDGKTMTATQKSAPGVTPAVNNVLVFDKQ